MVIDTVQLEKILDKRRSYIEKYENIEARYQYQHWMYYNRDKGCCNRKEPTEPKIKKSCCGDKENALDFYKAQVMECDESALTTYDKIVESRLNRHDRYTRLESAEGRSSSVSDISKMIREALGLHSSDDLVCSTAFVEFKSLTAKQSEAPDPRDLLWANVICERRYIERRKLLVEFLLCVFVLLWGAFVATITEVANSSIDGLKLKNYDLTRFRLYVPTLIISLILLWIPKFLFIFAMRIIKFKSFSQCDEFVIKWNTAFRVTNIVFIFFSISLIDAVSVSMPKMPQYSKLTMPYCPVFRSTASRTIRRSSSRQANSLILFRASPAQLNHHSNGPRDHVAAFTMEVHGACDAGSVQLLFLGCNKAITNKFVIHSFNLPIKIARIHDEEEKALLKKSKIKRDGGENFMYRNPQLNHRNWDEKPFRWM
eukprot:scaffold248505_cov58-Cyclotella_meneghiniana.AAC.1